MARYRLARRLLQTLPVLVCMGAGFGVSTFIVTAPTSPGQELADTTRHGQPPATAHPSPPAYPERIRTAVRSANYEDGLRLLKEYSEDETELDTEFKYCKALCLEGTGRWSTAEEAYRELGSQNASLRCKLVAELGLIRCLHARGDETAALHSLKKCQIYAARWPDGVGEVAFLNAVVALKRIAMPAPGPFAPEAVSWPPVETQPAWYLDWIPIVPAPAERSDPVAQSELDPPHPASAQHDPIQWAEIAVRYAIRTVPEHPGIHHLHLAAANLSFLAGRTTEAIAEYRALCETAPPETAASVYYNLGLASAKRWSLPRARSAFLTAVDLDPGGRFRDLGFWWIGRIELDRGDTSAAREAWGKVRDCSDREIESAIGMGELITHLLDGEAERAFDLFRQHKCASRFPHVELSALIENLERYYRTPTEMRAASVAAAVRAAEYGHPFGAAGHFLCGGVLRQVGRFDEAAEVFNAASETAHGYWAVRMTYEVAEHMLSTGRSTAARAKLKLVASADAGEIGRRARFHLARLAITSGRGEECVSHCRWLLDHSQTDRQAVLRLMGRGYDLLGRRKQAAECYAGRIPAGTGRSTPPGTRP